MVNDDVGRRAKAAYIARRSSQTMFAQTIFSLIALRYLPKPIVCQRETNVIVQLGNT
jgi:hypothetical protein